MERRKKGRPPIVGIPRDRKIAIRLTETEARQLAAIASWVGVTRSELIRALIQSRIAQEWGGK